MNVGLRQHVPQDQLEIQMERKDIYNHIIAYAESCGVKFEYETEVHCICRTEVAETKKIKAFALFFINFCKEQQIPVEILY